MCAARSQAAGRAAGKQAAWQVAGCAPLTRLEEGVALEHVERVEDVKLQPLGEDERVVEQVRQLWSPSVFVPRPRVPRLSGAVGSYLCKYLPRCRERGRAVAAQRGPGLAAARAAPQEQVQLGMAEAGEPAALPARGGGRRRLADWPAGWLGAAGRQAGRAGGSDARHAPRGHPPTHYPPTHGDPLERGRRRTVMARYAPRVV